MLYGFGWQERWLSAFFVDHMLLFIVGCWVLGLGLEGLVFRVYWLVSCVEIHS